ncbi:MAG: hypothetical protein Q8P41_12950 [Pseudomonadota bacterium]|nr:hypothetical protein [Pseudomonadota bacterium]
MATPALGLLGPFGIALGAVLLLKAADDAANERRRKQAALDAYWTRRRQRAHEAVLGIAKRIKALANLHSLPPFVQRPGSRNAWVQHGIISYDPDWIMELLETYCSDTECNTSVVVGIIAHELGHWIHGDDCDIQTHPWHMEYRADGWAAWVLASMGIASSHFECVLATIDRHGGPNHPPGPARARRIRVLYWRWLGYEVAA